MSKVLDAGKELSFSNTCQITLDIIDAVKMTNTKVLTKAMTSLIFLKFGVVIGRYCKRYLQRFDTYY